MVAAKPVTLRRAAASRRGSTETRISSSASPNSSVSCGARQVGEAQAELLREPLQDRHPRLTKSCDQVSGDQARVGGRGRDLELGHRAPCGRSASSADRIERIRAQTRWGSSTVSNSSTRKRTAPSWLREVMVLTSATSRSLASIGSVDQASIRRHRRRETGSAPRRRPAAASGPPGAAAPGRRSRPRPPTGPRTAP